VRVFRQKFTPEDVPRHVRLKLFHACDHNAIHLGWSLPLSAGTVHCIQTLKASKNDVLLLLNDWLNDGTPVFLPPACLWYPGEKSFCPAGVSECECTYIPAFANLDVWHDSIVTPSPFISRLILVLHLSYHFPLTPCTCVAGLHPQHDCLHNRMGT
jgi:hypothetical protein